MRTRQHPVGQPASGVKTQDSTVAKYAASLNTPNGCDAVTDVERGADPAGRKSRTIEPEAVVLGPWSIGDLRLSRLNLVLFQQAEGLSVANRGKAFAQCAVESEAVTCCQVWTIHSTGCFPDGSLVLGFARLTEVHFPGADH